MVKTFPPLVILLSGKIKKSNGFRLSFPSVSVTTAPSACYQLKLRHNHVQQTTVLNPHPTLHSGSETPAAARNSVVRGSNATTTGDRYRNKQNRVGQKPCPQGADTLERWKQKP